VICDAQFPGAGESVLGLRECCGQQRQGDNWWSWITVRTPVSLCWLEFGSYELRY